MPIISRSRGRQNVEKFAKAFFHKKVQKMSSRKNKRFVPPPVTIVYPGMPVMLRYNICPGLGLSNGSMGSVIAVIKGKALLPPHESEPQVLERCCAGDHSIPSLLVSFPTYYRGALGAVRCDGVCTLQRWSRQTVLVEPQMFERVKGLPISPAHAITMHKSQSLTLPYSILDPREAFCEGALYVAFSRSPSLERIALLSKVSTKILNKYARATKRLLETIAKIQEDSNSLQAFRDIITQRERVFVSRLYDGLGE